MYAERCSELQQQTDALRRDLEAAQVNNAHLLRVRSILELSEKRLAEAVAQVSASVRVNFRPHVTDIGLFCIQGFGVRCGPV